MSRQQECLTVSRFLAIAAITCTLVLGAAPATADAVADFYKGKTVSIVVGYSAGGGADLWARFLARHLGNHIPGKPNVIVQNMPGASGFTAVNHVYNSVPQDGTRIILPSVAVPTAAAVGLPNVRWDTLKFNWLGNVTRDAQSCVASGRSGIKSIVEASKREIIVGSDGASNSTGQHPRLLTLLFGYKLKIITGYDGTAQVRLAMEAGEVDAVCSVWASSALGPQRADIDSGKLVPIVQMGSRKHAIFGNAPMVYELTQKEEDLQLMRFVFGPGEISRALAVGPGTPPDRVAALRDAVWAAANSPELRADAEKQKLVVDPMDWKETEAAYREVLAIPANVVARAKDVVK
jgi:tripartite-type tricarboxylate transporter receptor subunit TctC